ncbi:MAG: hypothetical protein K0Q60_407 [Microvirga sp.]|nr:hypothetical protein [Microvirga sp.]
MTTRNGFLAIWSDVPSREETNYLHWLTREHTAERVTVPGFVDVRVFRARVREPCRYFILYRLERPDVVASEGYLARLNSPTEWSRRIMPILGNFVRGGGRVLAESGQGEGATVIPVICHSSEVEPAHTALRVLATLDRVVAARLCEVDQSRSGVATNEKSLRANDQSFPALLFIEALDDVALQDAFDELRKTVRTAEAPALYDQVFALRRAEITAVRDD